MQPNGPKAKSGIPQLSKKAAAGSLSHRSKSSDDDPPAVHHPQTSTHNPLAAVTNKKKAGKKNQVSESWADVAVESQSQKMKSYSQTDSMRRKEELERQLREAEGQLGEMSGLLEKREKLLEESKKSSEGRIEELEDRLMCQEGIMAEHGIDPVTGEKVPVSDENKQKVQASKKITKKTVEAMREKLRDMNRQTEIFLADIENTMQYLASLEDSSSRVGPFSAETQAMIDRISGDEEAIKQVYDENTSAGKKDNASKEDEDDQSDGGDRFFITGQTDEAGSEIIDVVDCRSDKEGLGCDNTG